jgi:hypothetical protein
LLTLTRDGWLPLQETQKFFVDDPGKLYRQMRRATQAKGLETLDSKASVEGPSKSPRESPPHSPKEDQPQSPPRTDGVVATSSSGDIGSGCYLSMLAISLRLGITRNPKHLLHGTSQRFEERQIYK